MSAAEVETSRRDRRGDTARTRRIAITVAKVVFGLGILAMIASNLSLDDQVVLRDGTVLEGRELRVEGELVFRDAAGKEERVPLGGREHPALTQRDDGSFLVQLPGKPVVDASEPRFAGTASLVVDGENREWPLEQVAWRDGLSDDRDVEKALDVKAGLITIFGRLSLGRYALAMALIFSMYLLGITRWWILLRAQGLAVRYGQAFWLTFIGFFFNNVVPGLTGGDVVKALMIARAHPGRGAAAVSTVVVDRVLGILVLAMISAVVLLFVMDRYLTIALWLYGFLAVAGLGIGLFLSRRVRRALKLDALLKKLPGSGTLQRLDEAFLLYRSRKDAVLWAILLSLGSHVCNITSIYLMGTNLGLDSGAGLEGNPLVTYFVTVPIILIASSIPLLPGGWGLGELMYASFFRAVGITNLGLSIALSVLTRISQLLWSLLGSVFLILHRSEAREAVAEARESGADGA